MGDMSEQRRWNVFAAVLEDILHAHDPAIGIGHLDDRPDPLSGALIHREKVRRLQHSLLTPKSFPVLLPDELEQVARAFHFTSDELRQLQAAVLATSIEATLMDRIPNHLALAAAQVLLPLLTTALRECGPHSSLAAVKNWQSSGDQAVAEEVGEDSRLTCALQLLEQGELSMYLSEMTEDQLERGQALQQAAYCFAQALHFLDEIEEHERDDAWQYWYQEAQGGFANMQNVSEISS